MNQFGITRDHVTGFVVGVGVAAAGYYVYLKNKEQVDEMLANYGIRVPQPEQGDLSKLTLEELMLKKETIEDLIAEKEMALEDSQPLADSSAE
ncbi:MAG: hypothetical protein D5S00_07150 [Tindallia sp. MSAO_Bac2]|nr:MAG: hypothetical protein D5S00_07150 [Tindallia sp. MSAO_Bac2]